MTEGKSLHAFRGSSRCDEPQHVRVASRRNSSNPRSSNFTIGIRLVEVVDDPAPVPAASGSLRVSRGGGWYFVPQVARVADRGGDTPGYRNGDLGIRLVEVVDDSNPHVPRNHRLVRGGSWRFKSAEHDRNRAYPRFHTSENVGIRLVEVIDE